VEELECSYLSDVELVSANQNAEDRPTVKVSGENETLFWLQPSFGSFLLYRYPINVDACYDTIRDAILTCARKPTQVSLIYHTEPTTKKV